MAVAGWDAVYVFLFGLIHDEGLEGAAFTDVGFDVGAALTDEGAQGGAAVAFLVVKVAFHAVFKGNEEAPSGGAFEETGPVCCLKIVGFESFMV